MHCNHELRTPMAVVISLLDILICDNCLTNEQYSIATQIRKCSTALLQLLNNILDLSKVSYKTSQLLISTYCVSKQARVYVHTITKWRELVDHLQVTIYQNWKEKHLDFYQKLRTTLN